MLMAKYFIDDVLIDLEIFVCEICLSERVFVEDLSKTLEERQAEWDEKLLDADWMIIHHDSYDTYRCSGCHDV